MKSLKSLILVALVVCAVPTFAAVDAFMKIEGIKGESTDASHSSWIGISSFSWGSPATPLAANIQGCATGEIKFTVQGNAVPLLTQKCQRNERLPEVTIEFMNTRHVLQGASIRSCQNNLFTMRFDRPASPRHGRAGTDDCRRRAHAGANSAPDGRDRTEVRRKPTDHSQRFSHKNAERKRHAVAIR